jgi:hypothetical protein
MIFFISFKRSLEKEKFEGAFEGIYIYTSESSEYIVINYKDALYKLLIGDTKYNIMIYTKSLYNDISIVKKKVYKINLSASEKK